jgi:hypothetical protein
VILVLELAAKMGSLFEAKFRGDLLDKLAGEKELLRGADALFIEPMLGGTAPLTMKLALKLAVGHPAQAREVSGVVLCLWCQRVSFVFP